MIDRLRRLWRGREAGAGRPAPMAQAPTMAAARPVPPAASPMPQAPAAAPKVEPVAPSAPREWPRKAPEPDPQRARQIQRREAVLGQSIYFKHWQAIKAEGITASQFMEFLQPFADLDGISVSYIYSDPEGNERIYNHRKDDSFENPLSVAIKEKKISRDQALDLALNEEGRVWIESNFMDLK
ncbi:hypothetical protein [Variovorax boronicumulans]|uniref:hypothetical protein n=1 Tax=Variovorax boronicumulans TaxID=436515 RepID=UPI001C589F9A